MSETTASQYPAALDALLRIVDGLSRVKAEDLNAMQKAVEAIETVLGGDVKGSESSLADRLAVNFDGQGRLLDMAYGTVTTSNNEFSVAFATTFAAAPKIFAMTMGNPTANGAVIWAGNSTTTGATFYGARRGGTRTGLDSVTVAWLAWNPTT